MELYDFGWASLLPVGLSLPGDWMDRSIQIPYPVDLREISLEMSEIMNWENVLKTTKMSNRGQGQPTPLF